MILFENPGIPSLPLKWRALINLPNIGIGVLIISCIILGVIASWSFMFWFTSFYVLILAIARIYMIRKARSLLIESLDDGLRIVYWKYFSIRDIKISNEDVKIELYISPYGYITYGKPYYLYFYSRSDEQIDIELKKDFYIIGKILSNIHDEQKILLGNEERSFINRYRKQIEFNNSTKGKITNAIWVIAFIILIVLIFYSVWKN